MQHPRGLLGDHAVEGEGGGTCGLGPGQRARDHLHVVGEARLGHQVGARRMVGGAGQFGVGDLGLRAGPDALHDVFRGNTQRRAQQAAEVPFDVVQGAGGQLVLACRVTRGVVVVGQRHAAVAGRGVRDGLPQRAVLVAVHCPRQGRGQEGGGHDQGGQREGCHGRGAQPGPQPGVGQRHVSPPPGDAGPPPVRRAARRSRRAPAAGRRAVRRAVRPAGPPAARSPAAGPAGSPARSG